MAFLLPYLPALINAAGAIGGGLLARRGSEETDTQGQKRTLIDQIMASLSGDGPYSDLFQMDEEAFNKSFVEPAKQRFRDVTAPSIQQQYIASGQQRGTGLDDSLARAGIDMDQMLNQQYADFQGQGQDRMMKLIQSVLGAGDGARPAQSFGNAAMQGGAGFLSGEGFQKGLEGILEHYRKPANQSASPTPEGFI